MQRPLSIVAIFGPTGIGKTAVAIALAERLRAEGEDPVAVSADALQLYRGLEVLTGAATPAERERLEHRLLGVLPLTARSTAAAIRPQDAQRVTRALELLDAGQAPPPGAEASRLWTAALRRPTLLAGLTMERSALVERIEARVDAMIAAGAEQEVRAAAAAGASRGARQALGFQALLGGDVDAMKTQTRRYAKRQLTWMRKLPDVTPIDVTGRAPADVAAELHAALRARESA